jgi:hypothetical protein
VTGEASVTGVAVGRVRPGRPFRKNGLGNP